MTSCIGTNRSVASHHQGECNRLLGSLPTCRGSGLLRSGRKSDAVFNERHFGDCFSLRNWVYYRGPFYRNPPPPPTTGAFGFLNFNQSGDRPDPVARAWPLQDDTLRSELAGVPEDDIGLRVLLVDARRAGSSVGCWQALPCAPRSALAAGPGAFRRKPKVNAAPASHALLGAGSVAGYAPLAFSSKGSRHKASNRWGVQPIAYLRQH